MKQADPQSAIRNPQRGENMKRVPLILFGAGKVGRALVKQLSEAALLHAQRDGLEFQVVAWCDRDGAVVDEDGLGPEALQAVEAAMAGSRSWKEFGSPLSGDLPAIVDVAGADGCIVVDVTASNETVPALEFALGRGYDAAIANKIPLVGPQATFDRLTRSRQFRYETTVGSAVPVIEATLGLLRAADRVEAIRGVLSGTLGFLCTGLQAGQPLSALVPEAMRRGYTEPDPRIDLGGMDVARKALILGRTLGWKLELADVEVHSLVPSELASLPLTDFLGRLPELDAEFAARVTAAAGEGKVLRYVAELREGKAAVGLQAVPVDTALGRLKGNDNLVAFHTRYYPDEPLVLQGRGAGVDAAAAGVHSDIVALGR
jgi:homoserine dehydrogenase